MVYINNSMLPRTNKHLSIKERFYIEKRLRAKDSITNIANTLGRSRSTIHNEIKRGTVEQIKQDKLCNVYCADFGQRIYEKNRKNSIQCKSLSKIEPFITWVEENFFKNGWSFDASVGRAIEYALFNRDEMVCTKTLYNYLHQDLLLIKTINLPLIVRRSICKSKNRKNKHILGKSIDERPENINTRTEFGHWEIDTVRGIKSKEDEVLITLLERKTRMYVALKSPSTKAKDIKETLRNWLMQFDSKITFICKTITSDNGLEFSKIHELETKHLKIYFAHPYSAWERGSNEKHNGLLRRFIKKGTPIRDIPVKTLKRYTQWCNELPRKILNYKTPNEVFFYEIKKAMNLKSVQLQIAI